MPTARAELHAFLHEAWPEFTTKWGGDRGFAARLHWQQILHRGGWVAPGWAPEHGGRGLSMADQAACDAELAAVGAPLIAGVLGVSNVGPAIAVHGRPDQQTSLPRILAGDEIWCQGFSEPDAGSDLASLRLRATEVDDGFVVTGQKVWTSHGLDATHCQLLARTGGPGHAGISCLLIPLDLPAVTRRPIRQIDGGAEFAELHFDDVVVPRSALLGPLHGGWKVAMTTLAYERTGVITRAARLEADVIAAVRAVSHRSRPEAIAADGSGLDPRLRQELVRRYVEARVLGLLGQRALAGADGPPGPEHAVIKLAWGLCNQRVGETLLRAAGPAGVAGGDPEAEFHFLRSRSSTIAAGTTEVLRSLLAERTLGLPR
ncbi:MAG TPA: acyl-CoA dehydrogenase family protein [Acidimicrobiia bacterium]|nr:acyl-CoA dehydrogenase family protein [Acidimicrobiia bacterium]